jgi:alcohol dehydrogenase class IV
MGREDMAMAALQSGIALTNAGLGAVHGFAAPLGAKFPSPHGAVCGVLLPHVVEANIRSFRRGDPGIQRYSDVGRLFAYEPMLDDEPAAEFVLEACRELASEARLPSLRTYGVTKAAIPEIVEMAKKSSSMRYNPVKLTDETLAGILKSAL